MSTGIEIKPPMLYRATAHGVSIALINLLLFLLLLLLLLLLFLLLFLLLRLAWCNTSTNAQQYRVDLQSMPLVTCVSVQCVQISVSA